MPKYDIDYSDPLKPGFEIPTGGFNGPGSANVNSSLRLYGDGALQWGESVDENMLRLLEHFASASPPVNPISGQLWVRQQLYWREGAGPSYTWYVFDFPASTPPTSAVWNIISVSENAGPPPLVPTPSVGDYWFDSTDGPNGTLWLYDRQYKQTAEGWIQRAFIISPVAPTSSNWPTQDLAVYDEFAQTWNIISASGLTASSIAVTPYGIFTGPTVQNALQQLNDGKVSKVGDSMSGNLTMTTGATVTGLPTPVNPSDAVTKQYVDERLPSGTIVMWSPTAGPVPPGWALCDGTLGTPDLRQKFIVAATGVGAGSIPGGTNGGGLFAGTISSLNTSITTLTTVNAGFHSHTGSTQPHTLSINEIPAHFHYDGGGDEFGVGTPQFPSPGTASNDGLNNLGRHYPTSSTGGSGAHSHGITGDGSHTHLVQDTGSHLHIIIPPFYALVFIMKL